MIFTNILHSNLYLFNQRVMLRICLIPDIFKEALKELTIRHFHNLIMQEVLFRVEEMKVPQKLHGLATIIRMITSTIILKS
jgi:hypothetical protein